MLSREESAPACTHIPPTSTHTLHLDPKLPCGRAGGIGVKGKLGRDRQGAWTRVGPLSSQPHPYPLASRDPQSSDMRTP